MVEEATIVLGKRNPGDPPLSYIADGYEAHNAGGSLVRPRERTGRLSELELGNLSNRGVVNSGSEGYIERVEPMDEL